MQCFKCSKEIAENERFCSFCGTGTSIRNHQQIGDTSDFLEFVRKTFKGFMTFILIAIIIISTIVGGALGALGGHGDSVFGVFLGLIIGFIVVILGGGVLATFIEIGDNIRVMREDIEKIKNQNKGDYK
ncbi:MAG: zinc ribbon domain-containing protein [Candidatus Cloacimonetes bacterium]|nr:zinc ribbon domain-containing protein [Candidatus Cloacimonadota bacterium]